jgi:hypothetical protein
MQNNPSIYILRDNIDDFPKREVCSPGDIVIMSTGDLLVWSGMSWLLAPGRYITVEELKEFVRYVSSGWPEDSAIFISDMSGLISDKRFLEKIAEICEKLPR